MACVKQRGKNSYLVIVSKGYDIYGKRLFEQKTIKRPREVTDFQWKKELEKLVFEFERDVEKGTYLSGGKINLKEFTDRWLSTYAEKELQPKTLVRYKGMLDLRILPALGHIKLEKLQPVHFIEFYNSLRENGIRLDSRYEATEKFLAYVKDNNLTYRKLEAITGVSQNAVSNAVRGYPVTMKSANRICEGLKVKRSAMFAIKTDKPMLASLTILHHHRLLYTLMETAMQWQLIESNPVARVKSPRVTRKPIQHYDIEQTKKLISELDKEDIKYRTMVILDIFTGARLGELMGLEWDNIDMDNNIVEITKASQHTVEKGTFDKKPKNESSIRKISIPEPVKQILKEYRIWWLKQKVLAGEDWEDTNKLFATQYGKPMFPYALSGWLPKFLEEHNLPKITPHGLRHTMATVLASQGLPVTAISHRLGHARTSTTMDIYVHALQSADTAASDYLQEALL